MAGPDRGVLGSYLASNIRGFGILTEIKRFAGGQSNPTFLLTASSGRYVLRQRPLGTLLASAHAVDREYRLLKALEPTAVPVARPLHYCADASIVGAEFYVMEFIDGEVHWDAALTNSAADLRTPITFAMVDTLAALHQVDWGAAGLSDFGRHSGYAERQIARWTRQYRASVTRPNDRMEVLIAWLERHVPADDGRSAIVHGDFRIDNLLYARGENRVLAVIDWELATIGHPFADLAYMLMHHRLRHDGPFKGLAGVDRHATGLPDENAVIARYAGHMGDIDPNDLLFWIALSAFRLAAVLEGVNARIEAGNAADPDRGRRLVQAIPDLLDLGLAATAEAVA